MTKEIAKLLVLAQAGSDIGKEKKTLYNLLPNRFKTIADDGYYTKDKCINKLVNIIAKYPQQDVHFYVCRDAEHIANYIIYFDFIINDLKHQVSFHSFDKRLERFIKGSKKSHTEWDMNSSRAAAYELGREYGLVYSTDDVIC